MIVGQLISEKGLISMPHNSTIREVAKIMTENSISSVVLKDGDKIVGIITERDIVRAVSKGINYDSPAMDMATKQIIRIDYNKSIYEAYDLMTRNNIRHLVVEKEGKCIGVISIRDLTRALSVMLAESMSY